MIIIRHGEQIINDVEAKAVLAFAKGMEDHAIYLKKKLASELGRIKPEYAERFEHKDADLWEYSESLEEQALNLFDQ